MFHQLISTPFQTYGKHYNKGSIEKMGNIKKLYNIHKPCIWRFSYNILSLDHLVFKGDTLRQRQINILTINTVMTD